MKKILIGTVLLVFVSVGHVFADDETITKLTYFPISYVGYNQLNATNLEVGVGVQPATGQLGKAGLNTPPFNVDVTVTIPQEGQLNLNGSNVFYLHHFPVSLGEGATDGNSTIIFERNLRIGGGNAYFKNLSADTMSIDKFVFYDSDHPFPPCTEQQNDDGNNMHWVKLRLKDAPDKCAWYLVCGSKEDLEECDADGSISFESTCKGYHDQGKNCDQLSFYGEHCTILHPLSYAGDELVGSINLNSEDEFNEKCCGLTCKEWDIRVDCTRPGIDVPYYWCAEDPTADRNGPALPEPGAYAVMRQYFMNYHSYPSASDPNYAQWMQTIIPVALHDEYCCPH